MLAAQAIQCGDASAIVAGGTENMSRAPYLLEKARNGYRMGNGEIVDAMIRDGLWDVYNNVHMGTCGDACAKKYEFSPPAAGRLRHRQLQARPASEQQRARVQG
jgi:acetyl-CoA C-acetyltransferase